MNFRKRKALRTVPSTESLTSTVLAIIIMAPVKIVLAMQHLSIWFFLCLKYSFTHMYFPYLKTLITYLVTYFLYFTN